MGHDSRTGMPGTSDRPSPTTILGVVGLTTMVLLTGCKNNSPPEAAGLLTGSAEVIVTVPVGCDATAKFTPTGNAATGEGLEGKVLCADGSVPTKTDVITDSHLLLSKPYIDPATREVAGRSWVSCEAGTVACKYTVTVNGGKFSVTPVEGSGHPYTEPTPGQLMPL